MCYNTGEVIVLVSIGKRLIALRNDKKIDRSEAAEYFGITEDELLDIEIYNADYDIDLLLKSCDLYNVSLAFLLDENEDICTYKSLDEDDYGKYEDYIVCVDNLRNVKKSDVNYIKKPDDCKGESSNYFAWRVLSTDYCLKGYITLHRIEKLEALYEGDIIVAIIKQKPVYGFFTIYEGGICIRPLSEPGKHLSLKARGSKVIGVVKHLEVTVC